MERSCRRRSKAVDDDDDDEEDDDVDDEYNTVGLGSFVTPTALSLLTYHC